jgi:hypothetical protein
MGLVSCPVYRIRLFHRHYILLISRVLVTVHLTLNLYCSIYPGYSGIHAISHTKKKKQFSINTKKTI